MKIIIDGKPIAKMRPKYSKRGNIVITYDPQEKEKKRIRHLMSIELSNQLNSRDKKVSLEAGKICRSQVFFVDFVFFLPINSSDSVSIRNKKLWGIIDASCKPDYDNLEKFYLDCANGIFWSDDRAIVKASAKKLFDENPRVEIVIRSKNEMALPKKVEKVITTFSPYEFKEFLNEISQLIFLGSKNPSCIEDDILEQWITTTACSLSKFALKYADKLNKIAKEGDLVEEIKYLEEFKECLSRGDYAVQETNKLQ